MTGHLVWLIHGQLLGDPRCGSWGRNTRIYSDPSRYWRGRPTDERPKLILLDLKLPKMTGLEVLRRLKADPRTRSIPVVIFTSSAQECDVAESYQAGVNSYVIKPLAWDALTEVVGQVGSYWLEVNYATDQRPRGRR